MSAYISNTAQPAQSTSSSQLHKDIVSPAHTCESESQPVFQSTTDSTFSRTSAKKPAILAPVGDSVCLQAAIQAGATEVYFGVEDFNMRVNAKNFRVEQLDELVLKAHAHAVRAYLALNIIVYESELDLVRSLLFKAKSAGIDAVICWDFAVMGLCQELHIPIHVSTQASLSSSVAINSLCERFPAITRVVLARECTLQDIFLIAKSVSVELETFIHGAMCVSISGRCFLSQDVFGKSANRGECYQNCRKSYQLTTQTPVVDSAESLVESQSSRPAVPFTATNSDTSFDVGDQAIFSAKDLCTIPFFEQLLQAPLASLKIEGRTKGPEYVYAVVKAYVLLVDAYFAGVSPEQFEQVKTDALALVSTVYNRGFSTGFYLGKPLNEWSTGTKHTHKKMYVGYVVNYYPKVGVCDVYLQASSLSSGQLLQFEGETTGVVQQVAQSLQVIKGEFVQVAQTSQTVSIKVQQLVRKNDKVYCILKV
jgi:U32 family peptidase